MKKEELEKYIGKKVKVTLIKYFDYEEWQGEFHKGGEKCFKNIPNLYYSINYYFCINPQSYLFRASHIKKIEEIEEND